ncbi:MAG TPA: hypothetical protein VIS03_06175 [Kiloniellaceae bacterium]
MRKTASWSGSKPIHRIQGCGAERRRLSMAPLGSLGLRPSPSIIAASNANPMSPMNTTNPSHMEGPHHTLTQ